MRTAADTRAGRMAVRTVRGFTLIEVLIGVLILALGVLGLGAIIPVVVREQRNAADTTLGVATANAARGDLLGKPGFDPASTEPTIWDSFLDNFNDPNDQWSRDGQWESWGDRTLSNLFYTGPATRQRIDSDFSFDPDTGEMVWDSTVQNQVWNPNSRTWSNQGASVPRVYTLPVASRLWPSSAGQPIELTAAGTDPYRPQFVWDIVARRVPPDAAERAAERSGVLTKTPGKIQIAIFVRRIDLSIRIRRVSVGNPARPLTLADVLTDWTGAVTTPNDRCVPVAMDRPTNTSTSANGARTSSSGLPTNRGNAAPGVRNYAEPIYLEATFDPNYPDQVRLTGLPNQPTTDQRWILASQAGQKLVDNLGNVYTVRGPAEETSDPIVVVDPPIPAWVPDPNATDPNGLIGRNPAKLNQVVFTPQIPAAVSVFTITRPVN